MPTLAVDFDGTIAGMGPEFVPLTGAVEYLRRLKRAGWRIIIHSSRANYAGGITQIEDALRRYSIPFDAIEPKPQADVYLDNRGEHFTNWSAAYSAVIRRGAQDA